MLMLITEMLITQGVTNAPYKSPHPRHREAQNKGDAVAHTDTRGPRSQSKPVVGRQVALWGMWLWVCDEWVDPDRVMTG